MIGLAPAGAVGAGFLAVAIARGHGDIEPDQWTEIAHDFAAGPHDFNRRPFARKRRGDLPDPRVFVPGVGVDLLQQLHFFLKADVAERVLVGIELCVGSRRTIGDLSGAAGFHRLHGVRGPFERGLRKLRGMRVPR